MRLRLLSAALFAVATLPAFAQTYTATELYAFAAYGNGDAGVPSEALIQASDGNYYGVSYFGGTGSNAGTIFRVTPTGQEKVVYSFCQQTNCTDGYMPTSLVEGSDGNFYGTTTEYQTVNNVTTVGRIWRWNPTTGAFTTMQTFTTAQPYYGSPVSIMQASDGNLYGGSGNGTSGSVWKLTLAGTFTTLAGQKTGFSMGNGAPLLEGSDGNLYGVNNAGNGAIFSISKSGTAVVTLYFFCTGKYCTDGAGPNTNLVEGADGAFYGATEEGGVDGTTGESADGSSFGEGVVYRYSGADGSETVLHSFCATNATCPDGARPAGNIQLGGDGAIYGLTSGTPYASNIPGFYRTTAEASGSTTSWYALTTGEADGGIVAAANGNIVFDTQRGGAAENGNVLSINTSTAISGMKPPISIGVSPATIQPGQSATLTWQVNNAYSNTAKYCFATSNDSTWSGIKSASGTITVKPGAAGTFTYALTCGGTNTSVAVLTVTAPPSTTTVLTVTPAVVASGANATLSARVTAQTGGTPTGSVTFFANGISLDTVNLSAGVASVTASTAGYPLGNYQVTAKYTGDDAPSTSNPVGVSIRNGSATTLSITPNPVTAGGNVMVSVSVKATSGSAVPSGTVAFSSYGQPLFSLTLSGGKASASVSTKGYAAGTYPILASYSGDANFAPSSVTVNEKVQ